MDEGIGGYAVDLLYIKGMIVPLTKTTFICTLLTESERQKACPVLRLKDQEECSFQQYIPLYKTLRDYSTEVIS